MIEWLLIATAGKTLADLLLGLSLPLFSVLGVFLSTSNNNLFKAIGFSCGIISQPVWFYFAITTHNLGMFINGIFFTLLWVYRLEQMRRLRVAL